MRYRHSSPQLSTCEMPAHPLLRRLAEALRSAAQANDAEFEERFRVLTAEIESAFFVEEAWMENMRLPSLKSHREQHARVLQGMHHAHAALLQGRPAPGRKAVERLLPLWLPAHLAAMRQAFATPKVRRDLSGVTARRRAASGNRQFRQ